MQCVESQWCFPTLEVFGLCKPITVIMSPRCAGLAGWQTLNHVLHNEVWRRSKIVSVPLERLCGQVALYQLRHGRHYLREHPCGTELYSMDPWPTVFAPGRAVAARMGQCTTGLHAHKHPFKHLKKPTGLVAGSEHLVWRFRKLLCDGSHELETIQGDLSGPSQVWTWKFASILASGCADLLREMWQQGNHPQGSIPRPLRDLPQGAILSSRLWVPLKLCPECPVCPGAP